MADDLENVTTLDILELAEEAEENAVLTLAVYATDVKDLNDLAGKLDLTNTLFYVAGKQRPRYPERHGPAPPSPY